MAEKFSELSPSESPSSDELNVDIERPPKKKRGRPASKTKKQAQPKKTKKQSQGHPKRRQTAMVMTPEAADTWSKMREKRAERVQEAIDELEEREVRQLLKDVALQHSGIFHSVVEAASLKRNPRPDPQPDPQPDEETPWWCVCTNCRWMTPPPHPPVGDNDSLDPNDECCHMVPEDCHSVMPEFDAFCIDEMSIQMNILYRNDVFALHATSQVDVRKSQRHAAYRLYVMWVHGKLQKADRRVVPSCCTLRIRGKFPSLDGHYTGFKPGTLL